MTTTNKKVTTTFLLCLLYATATSAFRFINIGLFSVSVYHQRGGVRGVDRWFEVHAPTRLERSASCSSEDSGVTVATSTPANNPAATTFSWRKTAARPRQQRADWSKLFATPEPKTIQGMPLVGLRRSFGDVASRSCYTLPMFLGMLSLMYTFSPMVAVQTMLAWGLGRITYWFSMRGADVSVRVPAGFVGYASLFMMAGGLVFLNGLKGISTLSL